MAQQTRDTQKFWNEREEELREIDQHKPSRSERIQALKKKALALNYDNPKAAEEASRKAAELEAEAQAEENALWTKEYTQQMRKRWNAAVKNPDNHNRRGKVLVGKVQREAGCSLERLKRHVARHNL